METTRPKGFDYAVKAKLVLRFTWFERLRIVLGRPTRLEVCIWSTNNPGETREAGTSVAVDEIGGRRGEP